jgi:hypothetical protein
MRLGARLAKVERQVAVGEQKWVLRRLQQARLNIFDRYPGSSCPQEAVADWRQGLRQIARSRPTGEVGLDRLERTDAPHS